MEFEIIKAIAAFLNTFGGILIIGISNDGKVIGLEDDYRTLGKKEKQDKFKLQINNIIKKHGDITITASFTIGFERIDDKDVCILKIDSAPTPIFIKDLRNNDKFYYRAGNASHSLNPKQTLEYVKQHWPNYLLVPIDSNRVRIPIQSSESTYSESEIPTRSTPESMVDGILQNFTKWSEDIWGRNILSRLQDAAENETPVRLSDYLFICLIPSNTSEDLVNLVGDAKGATISSRMRHGSTITTSNPDYYPPIERYFRDFRVIRYSQVYSTPKFLHEYNDIGSEMKIFQNGVIFLCFRSAPLLKMHEVSQYRSYLEEKPSSTYLFTLEPLFAKSTRFLIPELKKKYGLDFEFYYSNNLECVLKILLFPFHPNSKIKMVKNPTTNFKAHFIFPMMLFGGRKTPRILYQESPFGLLEYSNDEVDLNWETEFSFDEIPRMLEELKDYCYRFFRNKRDTAFM